MEVTDRGVCVEGFSAGGARKGKYGVAVIVSESEADCALVLTSNKVRAAPLEVSRSHASRGKVRGIVANSGNANAYTGEEGLEDALQMCRLAAGATGCREEEFLVASTGVIGRRVEIGTVDALIKEVCSGLECSAEASGRAARAIMTTDTRPKSFSVRTELGSGEAVEVGGIAKGAGMIAPRLGHATMLCFLTTDVKASGKKLEAALKAAVEKSFNRLVIDGDTSTNDLVILLANGRADNRDIDANFQEALDLVCLELAKSMAKDGEGATKFIEVCVKGAKSEKDAELAAKAVAGSSLVKTAFFGENPNWGRIVAALGYSGAAFDPGRLTLHLEAGKKTVKLVEKGKVLAGLESRELVEARELMRADEIRVVAELGLGSAEATAFGCDMGPDYVRINAEYAT